MSEKEQRELLGTCMRDIVPHRLNHHVIGWCQGWEPIASPQATRPQFQEPEIGSNSVNYSGDDCGDIENLEKCPTCNGYHAGGCHRAVQP